MTDPLTKIRETALELPETEERLSHGQPTFFVAGKQFAQLRGNHHGDGRTVDVDDAPRPTFNEPRRQDAHEAGEGDRARLMVFEHL